MAYDEGLAERLRDQFRGQMGLQEEDDLAYWVGVCQEFVDTLPPR